jgi:two-component sensor histidine kinase
VGTVGVELRDDPAVDHYSLVVWDDGVGIAADRIDQFTSSLGLQLVHSLAHQLDGTVELGSGSGTRLEIKFARRSVKEV